MASTRQHQPVVRDTSPTTDKDKENQKPSSHLATSVPFEQSSLPATAKTTRASHPKLTMKEMQRLDSIRSTVDSEIKRADLGRNGIKSHDFQEDADRRHVEAHPAWELEEQWEKQRELAQQYRRAVKRKEEHQHQHQQQQQQ